MIRVHKDTYYCAVTLVILKVLYEKGECSSEAFCKGVGQIADMLIKISKEVTDEVPNNL